MNVLPVAIVLSFPLVDTPEVTHLRIAEAIDRVDGSEEVVNLPICWNFPAAAAFDRGLAAMSTTRDALVRRIIENGDAICPMGLTGAPHRALTVEEIESDLMWAVSNIWGTGVEDATRQRPPLIIPRDGDSDRFDYTSLKDVSAPGIGVRLHARRQDLLLVMTSGGRHLLALVDWKEIATGERHVAARRVARVLRKTRTLHQSHTHQRPTILWLDAGGRNQDRELDLLMSVVTDLREGGGFEFIRFPQEDPASPSDIEPIDRTVLYPGNLALSPKATQVAAALRKRRKSKINTRRLLETLGMGEPTEGFAVHARIADRARIAVRAEREYVASMMGEARLAGPGVDALFTGGQFQGLSLPQRVANFDTASTILTVNRQLNDRRHDSVVSLHANSCFSFESEISHGLRVVAVDEVTLPGVTINVTTDFSFVNDYPILVVSPTVSIERTEGRDSGCFGEAMLALIAMPVDRRQAVVVSSVYPDGSSATARLHPGDGGSAMGTLFSVTHQGQELHFAAVSRSVDPLVWPLSMVPGSPPRLAVGGQFPVRVDHLHETGPIRYTILVAYDPDGAGVLQSVLTRRVPAAIRDELAAGP